MDTLNLPLMEAKLRREDGMTKIYDRLRRRYVALTPEEWVRQNFVNFLIQVLAFRPALMGNEITLKLNGMTRRCDTVVYDPHSRPLMIVEYKRPAVAITQKVFNQISRYDSVLRVPWLVVSNGLQHYCCHMDYEQQTCRFLDRIPNYDTLIAPQSEEKAEETRIQ